MHRLKHPALVATALGSAVVLALVLYVAPWTAPWVPTGRLVIATRAVPYAETDLTLVLGIDDMTIGGLADETQVSLLTRRATLDPRSDTIEVLLDTPVVAGAYDGFSMRLRSPELRNSWQGDAPPGSISLTHERTAFPLPYVVRENETTVLILSFETMQAIHDIDGVKTYLPVVQAEARVGSSVGTDEYGRIRIEGGTISTSAMYGMDHDGTMRQNFRAPVRAADEPQPDTIALPTEATSTPPEGGTENEPATTTAASSTEGSNSPVETPEDEA